MTNRKLDNTDLVFGIGVFAALTAMYGAWILSIEFGLESNFVVAMALIIAYIFVGSKVNLKGAGLSRYLGQTFIWTGSLFMVFFALQINFRPSFGRCVGPTTDYVGIVRADNGVKRIYNGSGFLIKFPDRGDQIQWWEKREYYDDHVRAASKGLSLDEKNFLRVIGEIKLVPLDDWANLPADDPETFLASLKDRVLRIEKEAMANADKMPDIPELRIKLSGLKDGPYEFTLSRVYLGHDG